MVLMVMYLLDLKFIAKIMRLSGINLKYLQKVRRYHLHYRLSRKPAMVVK